MYDFRPTGYPDDKIEVLDQTIGVSTMRKRMFHICMILWIVSAHTAFAHPGNTDANGGHTCRTNCEDWGLDYGEYHYHNPKPAPSTDDYQDGYDRGYQTAYGHTSQCDQDYDWWWEGPQAFGAGYEQGIKDGHQDGLEVCYQDSHDTGYDQGYADYVDANEYDSEPYETYDSASYEKGYDEGWSQAESEDTNKENEAIPTATSSDISSTEEETDSADQKPPFDAGYDEGFEAAREGYVYEDYSQNLSEKDLAAYKKGYFAGYIEAGGGTPGERVYYYSFQKHPLATTSIGTVSVSGLVWLILRRRRNKKDEVPPEDGKVE